MPDGPAEASRIGKSASEQGTGSRVWDPWTSCEMRYQQAQVQSTDTTAHLVILLVLALLLSIWLLALELELLGALSGCWLDLIYENWLLI